MNDFHYELIAEDTETGARAGVLHTPHGKIETPIFMPVGTQATVKTLDQHDLIEAQAQIILGNAYHLYLRPGHELIDRMGGLHQFMNWSRPILTDSGGFQVFSLGDLNKISEEGVRFQSHLDGSSHLFTPESVMEIEHGLGADIIMAFDECTPYLCEHDYAEKSMRRTLRWAERCIKRHQELSAQRTHRPPQAPFGIVQGSVYPNLRRTCAHELIQMDLPGYAIGGLAVGETRDSMFGVIRETTPLLPNGKPRYLMGVGLPNDLVEAVGAGADMFDCVVPTRNARNGTVFARNGRLRLKNAAHAEDPQPLESDCACKTCSHYSRAYLRHLFKTNELLGMHLATFHNVFFFQQLMRDMRDAIISGHFAAWQADFFALYQDS